MAERAAGRRPGKGGPALFEDQGLREGLQNEPGPISPAGRLEIARMLAAAGVRQLQPGSLVVPRGVPQMDGIEELVALVRRELPAVECARARALNEHGLERALGSRLRRLSLSVSVPLSLHLHGSRERTRADLLAGYRAGVHLFDAALAAAARRIAQLLDRPRQTPAGRGSG